MAFDPFKHLSSVISSLEHEFEAIEDSVALIERRLNCAEGAPPPTRDELLQSKHELAQHRGTLERLQANKVDAIELNDLGDGIDQRALRAQRKQLVEDIGELDTRIGEIGKRVARDIDRLDPGTASGATASTSDAVAHVKAPLAAAPAAATSAAAPAPSPGGSPSSLGRAPMRGRLVSDPRTSWADLADAETSIGSDTEDSNDVEALSRSHTCASWVDSSSETLSTASPECAEAGELPVHGAGFALDAAAHFGAYGFFAGAEPFLEAEGVAEFALEGDGADEQASGRVGEGDRYVYAGLVPVMWPFAFDADDPVCAAILPEAAAAAESAGAASRASAAEPARDAEGRAADAADGATSFKQLREEAEEFQPTPLNQAILRACAAGLLPPEEFEPTPLHQAILRACAAAEEHQQAVNVEKSLGTWSSFWWCSGPGAPPPVLEDNWHLGTEEQILAYLQGGKLSPLAEEEDSGEDAQGALEAHCDEAAPGAAGA